MNAKNILILLAMAGAFSVFLATIKHESKFSEFATWKSQFNMNFNQEVEESYRERVFLENLAKINAHNSKNNRTYTMGINKFTGMTQEQFTQAYLGTVVKAKSLIVEQSNVESEINEDIDWTIFGAVTDVKSQGACGSCWAFSATGALESLNYFQTKTLLSFSEQQLVDCSGSYGNHGCNGGLIDNAFKFVKYQGIALESEYPYTQKQGKCEKPQGNFKIAGFTSISNCKALAIAIAGRPISVVVDATKFNTYKDGVFSDCGTSLNHGVLLVGIQGGSWKVKNNWGSGWGQKGYILLKQGNTCGICNAGSYPYKGSNFIS